MTAWRFERIVCWGCKGWGYDRSTPEKRQCPSCCGHGEHIIPRRVASQMPPNAGQV